MIGVNIKFTPNGWEDYIYWINENRKIIKKINTLLQDIYRNGNLVGIGKPEPLKGSMQGFYSRRIDDKHRLVYINDGENIIVLACRGHY